MTKPDAAEPLESTPRLGEVPLQGPGWRWPRFGLRTLLLVLLLLAFPLGWAGYRAIQVRHQQAVVEKIAPLGGQAGWLGGKIVQVTFSGERFRDAALAELRGLDHLQRVVLMDTGVTAAGLAQLSGVRLTQLKILRAPALGDDAGAPLGSLSELRALWLEETGVGDAAMPQLASLARLRSLSLIGSKVTDDGLAPLLALPQLEEIYLQRTGVTEAGVERLRRELPKAAIAF